ncbi:DUF1810 family protein [Legionella cardiaca]|uniref:DUF1810 family protein n=1 Tax=Legionella cardiaca TaxID=1071983 RepID=A0ABY8AX96_9GAMM|nr:DUF1810 family protein [Legionella cardiaca]WED44061.1 DUF1810 family protein [Legionella cardiaca]
MPPKKKDPSGLKRFHDAQEKQYDDAYAEIKSGRKIGHWIWYILPQLKILGKSPNSATYGITDLTEACAYLQDEVLFSRYLKMVKLIAEKLEQGIHVNVLMGSYLDDKKATDALKLASSLTLFQYAAQHLTTSTEEPIKSNLFKLDEYCSRVLKIIEQQGYPYCKKTYNNISKAKEFTKVQMTDEVLEVKQSTPPIPHENLFASETALSLNKAPLVQMIVEQLIKNIEQKKHGRASWFQLNTENKVRKLTAISHWLSNHELNEANETIVLALIRDICAIKRNNLGLFKPHSLQEFEGLLDRHHFQSPPEQCSFSPENLANIKENTLYIDKLIQEKIEPQKYCNKGDSSI